MVENDRNLSDRYDVLLESITDSVFILDDEWRHLVVNDAATRFTGFSREELIGSRLTELFPGIERTEFFRGFQRVMVERIPEVIESTFRFPDGRVGWYEIHVYPITEGILCISRDITRRRTAEAALREAHREREQMLDTIVDGVVRVDIEGSIVYANQGAERILGLRRSSILERTYDAPNWRQIREDGTPLPRTELPIARAMTSGSEVEAQVHGIVRDDDAVTWLSVNAAPLTDSQGEVYGGVASFRDITAVWDTEEEHRRLTALIENSRRFVGIAEPTGTVLFVNRAGRELAGLTPDTDVTSLESDDFVPPDKRRTMREKLVPELLAEGVYNGRGLLRHFGNEPPVEVRVHAFVIEPARAGGRPTIGLIAEDIRKQRRMERELATSRERLRQKRQLEIVGRLAGGVAHSFNNLMTAVMGYAELSLEHPGLPREITENLKAIETGGKRAARLTDQLLAFGRKQMLKPRFVDLSPRLVSLRERIEAAAGPGVSVSLDPGTDRYLVYVDPERFDSMVLQLCENARDAMPDGGDLSLSLVLEQPETPNELPLHDYVCLKVRDTGPGMNEETRSRLFEPFFDPRAEETLQGLGLASVYGFVKQSAGYIWVDSEEGIGTQFRVHLPLVVRVHLPLVD